MEHFFEKIFLWFRTRKLIFALGCLLFLFVFSWLAFQLQFEENISKMLPGNAEVMEINQTIESSGFMDRLFIHVYSKNQAPDSLIKYADELANLLLHHPDSGLIRTLEFRLSDEKQNEVFEFVQNHLPIFLEDTDYDSIQKKLANASIQQAMSSGYQLLVSPAGAWSAPFFRKDPLNLTTLGLNKLNQLKLDAHIELYNGYYLSKDHKHLLMWIIPRNEPNETTENARLLKNLDEAIATINSESTQAEYFGTTAVAVGNAQRIKSDIQTTVSIAFTLLLLFLTWYFRRPLTILYLFTPVIFGALFALALLYGIKGSISAISLGIGSLIVGITIDFSLHFLNHLKVEGDTTRVLRDTSRPILTSSLTTASAFMCLTLLKSEALTDLGIFAAVSVVGASVATIVVLAQLIKPQTSKSQQIPKNFLHKLAAVPLEKSKILLAVVLVFSVLGLFFYNKVEFNGDMKKMNFMSPALIKAEQNLSALNGQAEKTIYLIAKDRSPERALAQNKQVGKILHELKKKYQEVSYANSSVLLLSQKEQKNRIRRWQQFWATHLDSTWSKLSSSGKKYRFKPSTFTPFANWVSQDFKAVTLDDLLQLKALNLEAFVGQKNEQTVVFNPLKTNHANLEDIKSYVRQKGIMVFDKAEFANSVVTALQAEFSSLIWASLIVVFLILLLFFRHSLLAILTLLPVVVSWIWVSGIMGLFHIQFNIFNIIVSSLIFGLGIDYAIFITSGLLHELKTGEKNISVYKTSILLSALTTICGVGALIFAKHPALHSMALISILGIGSAVVVSFSLQAFLIRLLIVNRSQKGYEPYTTFSLLNTIWTFSYFLVGCILTFVLAYIILPVVPVKTETKKQWVTWLSSKWLRSLTDHQVHIPQHKDFPSKELLRKPSVIIANHESFLDILVILGMYPRNILLTNDWVYSSPFFGKIVQYVGFYPVSRGFEKALPHLQKKVEEGYNICIFPEGTRSKTPMISRFHKGAFYVAHQLQLDIIPIVLHGYGHIMTKGDDFLLKRGSVHIKTLEVIKHHDLHWGTSERERYKTISKYFKKEFYKTRRELENCKYYRARLLNNYLYKGVQIEREARQILVENAAVFDQINHLIPDKSSILVIADRLGLLALLLSYVNDKRKVTALFQNAEDLNLAQNTYSYAHNSSCKFQLLQQKVDYTELDYIVIDQPLSNLRGENLSYVMREVLNRCLPNTILLLSRVDDFGEFSEVVAERMGDVVKMTKKIAR